MTENIKPRKHWKRVNVQKLAYSQDYFITADGKCIGVVYFEPNIQKPIIQVWKENVERIEVKDTPISKNAFTIENTGGG